MIDDLVPAAISNDGHKGPNNDWGYLMDIQGSLYSYFDKFLLSKYPEIKGTVFLPIVSQEYIPQNKGYVVSKQPVNSLEYVKFLKRIMPRFEMAFHGVKHSLFDPEKDQTLHECSNLSIAQSKELLKQVEQFFNETGIIFFGGKFPGYKYNQTAIELIRAIGAKWWALDVDMINKKCKKNDFLYNPETRIIYIPTNICGDIFATSVRPENVIKKAMKIILKNKYYKDPVAYIFYLYNHGLPITIQEHFQNQKTDGRRQTPNVYDDILSLDFIFGFLRGLDLWHTTCSQIAHYHDSYLHSTISKAPYGQFSIDYKGIWDNVFLSIKTSSKILLHIDTGKKFKGVFKNGSWIFNNIPVGNYKIE